MLPPKLQLVPPSLPNSTLPRLRRADTVLLIVDVQERLLPVMHEAGRVEKNCVVLARAARQLTLPILVTEQYPERLGRTVPAISEALALNIPSREAVTSSEPISKMLFSACTDKTLGALQDLQRRTVLLCGIEAHVCVLQSALDLIEQGYTVFVSHDAISSRQESHKQIGWERMRGAGAVPTTVESAIFELLREAGTADFKALLPLIK